MSNDSEANPLCTENSQLVRADTTALSLPIPNIIMTRSSSKRPAEDQSLSLQIYNAAITNKQRAKAFAVVQSPKNKPIKSKVVTPATGKKSKLSHKEDSMGQVIEGIESQAINMLPSNQAVSPKNFLPNWSADLIIDQIPWEELDAVIALEKFSKFTREVKYQLS